MIPIIILWILLLSGLAYYVKTLLLPDLRCKLIAKRIKVGGLYRRVLKFDDPFVHPIKTTVTITKVAVNYRGEKWIEGKSLDGSETFKCSAFDFIRYKEFRRLTYKKIQKENENHQG